MAKYTAVKCWHVTEAVIEPEAVKTVVPSFTVIKKSILKNGYRGYAIEDREIIEAQDWYTPFLLGEEVRFYLDGSGVYRLANCDLTDNELYFERLHIPIGYKPWIFYSWQSDHNPSRTKIGDALKKAVKHINENLEPRQPLEIVESTREEDGAEDIVASIKKNLDRCLMAIFDITNVASVGGDNGKQYPNANVVFEMSYALARKRPDQILLLKQGRDDLQPDDVPFDFTQNRRIVVGDPSKLSKEVQKALIDYLRRQNFLRDEVE